jgi:uncharacterized membrane protein
MVGWLSGLAVVLRPWSDLYNGSTVVSDGVTFVHLAGVLLSGGLAVAADRTTLRAFRRPLPDRGAFLDELHAVHKPVVAGLSVVVLSGVAMLLSDVKTFLSSPIFWMKMGLVGLLLLNGLTLLGAERRIRRAPGDPSPWKSLRAGSLRSGTLWVLTLLFGVMLSSIS